ncbi:MAG: VOC family protein [Chloroflexia bacterium]
MQTRIAHMQFNVAAANLPFYRELFGFLGWEVIDDSAGSLGVADAGGASLWFVGQVKDVANDYDGPGLNHLAIGAASIADVDATAEGFLVGGRWSCFSGRRSTDPISPGRTIRRTIK